MGTIFIQNAAIITGCGSVHPDGFVLIEDGLVASLGDAGRRSPPAGARILDAGGRYVLPGFINPHMHFYGALAAGVPCGRMRSFGQVLEGLWWKLDRALSLEDVRVSALLGAVASLHAGVTTVFDHHASYGAVKGSLDRIAQSVQEAGIRASLSFEVSDRQGKGARNEALDENASWLEYARVRRSEDPRFMLRGMMGLHASMTLSDETLALARDVMDAFGASCHVHVAEGIEDLRATRRRCGMTPVARLARAGALREGSVAAHCVHVDARDISMLAKAGCCVSHNPLSNLNNAIGVAPVLRMIHRGVPVAVGTDGMSASLGCDLRLAAVAHKIPARDAQAGWRELAGMLWAAAPSLASHAFGREVGRLRKGAEADLIIVDARPATPLAKDNALAHLLYSVLEGPVRTAIVGGRVRMQDFRIPGIDEAALAKEARARAKALWKRIR